MAKRHRASRKPYELYSPGKNTYGAMQFIVHQGPPASL
jgi:hypothetical protein